jgi:UDP-N-acetyl-D-glucosamine/UDP-N-acetyl-D-galactosamine dehydrogenase
MDIYRKLIDKETKLSVIGLGYVGLPIALEFAKKIKVIGFDIREDRLEMMRKKIDPSEELDTSFFDGCDIEYTALVDKLREATFHIVAVPTPIDKNNMPDLAPVLNASISVGKALKKGDYVVYESTVYPGCTEEDCIPLLEKHSGLKFIKDFKVGYSPERINPGDKEHTLARIRKVVSGCDEESLENISRTYEIVVKAGVYKASSIKVAESAKIIENTQRDVNIALMNELSMIFNKMNINTYEVLEAAGTKWNFLKFVPGLVGGHCIGVDPYYLAFKAKQYRHHPQIINAGRVVNDSMGFYVANQVVKKMIALGKNVLNSKILVMGATFKEDVSDIRNSKVADIINELKDFGVKVDVIDPMANSKDLNHEYGFSIADKLRNDYDAIIIAVNHKEYINLDESYFTKMSAKNSVLFDIKGIYRGKIKELHYMSL